MNEEEIERKADEAAKVLGCYEDDDPESQMNVTYWKAGFRFGYEQAVKEGRKKKKPKE